MATKINGKERSFVDTQFAFSGNNRPSEGVVNVEYAIERPSENVLGNGGIVNMWSGQEVPKPCSIEILLSDFENTFQNQIPRGRAATSVAPFNFTVVYADEGLPMTTDRWLDVRITGFSKATGADKKNMVIKLDCLPRKIEYNV